MRPSRTITKQRCPFHHRGLECKSRKSRQKSRLVTKGNKSSLLPGVTGKFGLGVQNEAGQSLTVLPKEHTVIVNTLFQQHKRRLYTWTSPDGQQRNHTDCILCSQRWKSSIPSAKTRPRADCGSDHKILIAKFRLKESRENH